nr:bifunctional IscS subfamily cysteine desulfurase/selenide, water dikinase SelD [Candidatus Cloacimonadota bacterium]
EILFDLDDIAASAGAACHSENIKVSPVLEALDVPLEYSLGAIRFSTGKRTSERDIYKAAEMIIATISKKNKKSIVKIN